MYVLTVTNFADTCSGRADTVSVYDTYDDARAVTPRTTAVDDLTVDVICHDDGTTGWPVTMDHLFGSLGMIGGRRAGVN